MSEPIDPQAFRNLCDLSIGNMYELEALGELLEQKGLLTKQEILDLATELKRKARPANSLDPSQEPYTAKENTVIEGLMAVILQHGLSADHAKLLLGAGPSNSWNGASRLRTSRLRPTLSLQPSLRSPTISFIHRFLYGEKTTLCN